MDMALPMCNACHMGGRVSTLIGRVGGMPYDRTTFEVSFRDNGIGLHSLID